MKTKIINDIKSRDNVSFVDIYVFHNSREYNSAANNHTDTLGMGYYIDHINDINDIDDPIREYDICELSRAEYAHSVLGNSCIDIDELWDAEESEGMKALVVRILI